MSFQLPLIAETLPLAMPVLGALDLEPLRAVTDSTSGVVVFFGQLIHPEAIRAEDSSSSRLFVTAFWAIRHATRLLGYTRSWSSWGNSKWPASCWVSRDSAREALRA